MAGNLTKTIPGTTKPFSNFVTQMIKATGNIFGDMKQAVPLIKQLVYKKYTKNYRHTITP